ncbi:alpha/beta hydrolase [Roseomonas nepalensis]|uniref:Alpha/beta hydrolase n=1 Tax=Muricoccus nepalensis TaxID=1854500 RepID=A0A502G316_9PROT|nr:alpha/beta hydrolase [Roseomonas nepalensis]
MPATAFGGTTPCPSAAGPALAVEDRFFDAAGVRIRYIEEGRGDPIVLVHGYTTNTEEQFVRPGVFQALAASYRVIAMDARGHGLSGKPHDPAQYGAEMGLDVVRLLDHLGLRRAHILGYSMGAHIVAQLVTMRPERFVTAILGGASGRRNWSNEDQRRVDIESAEMDQGLLTSQIVRLWPRNEPPPTDTQIRERSAQQLAGKDPRALAAVRRSNPAQVVTEAQMAAVTVPTLGIVGTADPYLRDFQQLKAAMPQLQLVTVEGASHGSLPGTPEFVRAILDFVRAHPASAAG